MRHGNRALVVVALLCGALVLGRAADAAFNLWEGAILKFEAQDKASPPEKGGILFTGSSSIVLWDLAKAFPGLPALNRGFGGSTIADVNHFFDRVVLPYAPKTIVFYSADNDLASGKSVEKVLGDFDTFYKRVREAFPEARLLVLGARPSVAREKLFPQQQEVNAGMAERLKTDPKARFIDTTAALLTPDGKANPDLLMGDGLHLNEKGYEVWTAILAPILAEEEPPTP